MNRKLSPEQVEKIREALKERSYWGQIQELAVQYNVSKACISRIKHGVDWIETSKNV